MVSLNLISLFSLGFPAMLQRWCAGRGVHLVPRNAFLELGFFSSRVESEASSWSLEHVLALSELAELAPRRWFSHSTLGLQGLYTYRHIYI